MEDGQQWRTKHYTRVRNNLARGTDKAKKEYLESIWHDVLEFQRTGHYDLMYMKTNELGWKENHGIQNSGTGHATGQITVERRQVLKIWENYITGLYNRPNWPGNLQVELEEVHADKKGFYILQSEAKKKTLSRRWRIRRLQEMKMYLAIYSYCWEKMVSEQWYNWSTRHIKLESGWRFHWSCNDRLKEAKSYKMQWPSHNQSHRTYTKDSSEDT